MKNNPYEEMHELKSYLLYAINRERIKLGIRKFNEKLQDKNLISVVNGFTTETKSTNINALLTIFDRLGYNIVAVKKERLIR